MSEDNLDIILGSVLRDTSACGELLRSFARVARERCELFDRGEALFIMIRPLLPALVAEAERRGTPQEADKVSEEALAVLLEMHRALVPVWDPKKRMARPVCKGDFTWRVWSASTYPVTGLEPWPRWNARASGLIKFTVSRSPHFWPGCRNAGSTVTPSVFSPPQTSFASPTRRPTLTCHQLIAGAWCSKARP